MAMKRVIILVLVFLMTTVIGICSGGVAEPVSPDAFLLKIRNGTTLDISYLRFDLFFDALGPDGADQFAGIVYSTPQAGEDFYRCELIATHPEKMRFLRIDLSYGVGNDALEGIIRYGKSDNAHFHLIALFSFSWRAGWIIASTYVLASRS